MLNTAQLIRVFYVGTIQVRVTLPAASLLGTACAGPSPVAIMGLTRVVVTYSLRLTYNQHPGHPLAHILLELVTKE